MSLNAKIDWSVAGRCSVPVRVPGKGFYAVVPFETMRTCLRRGIGLFRLAWDSDQGTARQALPGKTRRERRRYQLEGRRQARKMLRRRQP